MSVPSKRPTRPVSTPLNFKLKELIDHKLKSDVQFYVDVGGPIVRITSVGYHRIGIEGKPTILFRIDETELPKPKKLTEMEMILHVKELCNTMIRQKMNDDAEREQRQKLDKLFPMPKKKRTAHK
jgi:hypothetical protein